MQQTQRTILWVVFSVSLLLLWDNWQSHNGKPSMFGPQRVATKTADQAPAGASAPARAPGNTDASIPTAPSVKIGRAHV